MRSNVIVWVLALVGVAVLGLYALSGTPNAQTASETATQTEMAEPNPDNPVMSITVAGEANGVIELELFEDIAPGHVARMVTLAEAGAYDNVVFHRVIDGFMAQSGDVQHGKAGGDIARAGTGGSDMPDLKAEFSDVSFERGVLGMARAASPHSANSQFFIMFAPAPHLNGQYTVVGRVISGLDVLDAIKRGRGQNGAVLGEPDRMVEVTVTR